MAVDSNKIAASLYREHGKSLQSYVLRRVPGADASYAEDVVQETFAHTIRHLNNGKTVESPKGFLFATARNLVISMFYRRREYTATDATEDMDQYAAGAHTCSPQRRVAVQQQLDTFSAAIATLPDRYQEAFVRRRVWGESCREIAVAMKLSENAVSNYATLGWKLLLEYCEEHKIVMNDFSDQE